MSIFNIIEKTWDKYFSRRKNFKTDKFFIYWKHHIPGISVDVNYGLESPGTKCIVKYDGKIVSEGRSYMSSTEHQFSKREGRRHSMRRAIEALDLPKEIRTELYEKHIKSIKAA